MMIENVRLFIEEHATKSWVESTICEKLLIVLIAVLFAFVACVAEIAY